MNLRKRIEDAISLDEIGIASARCGSVVLHSAFQMIYAKDGDALRAVTTQGFVRPHFRGRELDAGTFFSGLPQRERCFAEQLAIALHLYNHPHVEVTGLDHFVALGAAACADAGTPDFFADQLGEVAGLSFEEVRIVLGVTEPAGYREMSVVTKFRDQGYSLAIGPAKGEQPPLDALKHFSPAIARIDGRWFQRISGDEGALRLLSHLVSDLQSKGTAVMIDMIETADQLFTAVSLGADYFQGFLLSRPQLAGMPVTDEAELPLDKFREKSADIIPLFRGG